MDRNTVICGDCLDVMRGMDENSIDAIVTDPPYGLSFMGKDWDHGIPGVPFWQESLRVAKPGAHMLAFGGTRTHHRLMVTIEDAGWEIRDCLMWLYGSGFPKSLDVSKAIDKISKRVGMFEEFAKHFAEQRKKTGLSQKDIAVYFPSKSGGLTGCVWNWENAANVPTLEQWQVLQPLLNLSFCYLPLIERIETEREIVSRRQLNDRRGDGTNYALGHTGNADITAPATPEAQRWNGWGTALKPAWEPVILARKPLEGTVAENVLKWGTGGINVDGGRIGTESTIRNQHLGPTWSGRYKDTDRLNGSNSGRWPANLLLDDIYDAVMVLDKQLNTIDAKIILEYYDNYDLPKLSKGVQYISSKGVEWAEKILRSCLLRGCPQQTNERGEPSQIWSEAHPGSFGENALCCEAECKMRQREPPLQGAMDIKGIQNNKSRDFIQETERYSNEDDYKRSSWGSRTPIDNGIPSGSSSYIKGNSTSPEWNKERQPDREFGDVRQFNPQERTQGNSEGIALLASGERTLKVLASDIPTNWLKYFTYSGQLARLPYGSAAMLDEQSGELTSGSLAPGHKQGQGRFINEGGYVGGGIIQKQYGGDTGGASRFFYTAKADSTERNKHLIGLGKKCNDGRDTPIDNPYQRGETIRKNHHPTVKPVDLLRYLCRLITPPGGVVLDPFAGSGSTGIAALEEGFDYILIEIDPEYHQIAKIRNAQKRIGEFA